MGGEHAMEHFDVCIGPNLTCMNDLLNRMGQFDHVEYKGEQVKKALKKEVSRRVFAHFSTVPMRKQMRKQMRPLFAIWLTKRLRMIFQL